MTNSLPDQHLCGGHNFAVTWILIWATINEGHEYWFHDCSSIRWSSLCHVWTMCYHWPLHCGLLCTLAPNKILLGLHVVMVLLLYKLHGLKVSACVFKQQRNRDQEVVIVWDCWDLVRTSTLTLTPSPRLYTSTLYRTPPPHCGRHKWMTPNCRSTNGCLLTSYDNPVS